MAKADRARLQADKVHQRPPIEEAKVATVATVEVPSVAEVGAPLVVPRDPADVSRQFATAYWRGRRSRLGHLESWNKAQDLLARTYDAHVPPDHPAARPDLAENPLKGC